MHKRKPIIKLSLVLFAVVLGILLAVLPVKLGLKDYNSFIKNIKLGIDLSGGVYAEYEAINTESITNLSDRIDGTVEMMASILDKEGYTEATVVRQGTTKIRVEVPNAESTQDIINIIGSPVTIRFELEDGTVVITGEHVKSAAGSYSPGGNGSEAGWGVQLSLTTEGDSLFAEATGNNIGKTMKIITTQYNSDGTTTDTPISTATINSKISGGSAFISGNFTSESSKKLANQIMSGAFGLTLTLNSSDTLSPTLGETALKMGLIAGGIALGLILIYMIVLYRWMGVAADISLLAYVVIVLFALQAIPLVQLTLPGIAGIILSIGMAVDSNVVIFERIKEEFRAGKQITTSFYSGFKKAFSAVIDSNITTIIAGISLFIFGTGSIRGFAVTLLIGIVVALFTTLVLTRVILKQFLALNDKNANLYNLKRDAFVVEEEEPAVEAVFIAKEEVASNEI